jgi:hypothetical protein
LMFDAPGNVKRFAGAQCPTAVSEQQLDGQFATRFS